MKRKKKEKKNDKEQLKLIIIGHELITELQLQKLLIGNFTT